MAYRLHLIEAGLLVAKAESAQVSGSVFRSL